MVKNRKKKKSPKRPNGGRGGNGAAGTQPKISFTPDKPVEKKKTLIQMKADQIKILKRTKK